MDSLNYYYFAGTNRLRGVMDNQVTEPYENDINFMFIHPRQPANCLVAAIAWYQNPTDTPVVRISARSED